MAGDEARESLELAGAAVQEAEAIGQSVVSRSGGLTAAVSGKGGSCKHFLIRLPRGRLPCAECFCVPPVVCVISVGDLAGIEETLHQFAMSVARAVWTVGDADATVRGLLQLAKERQRALDFKKMNMIGPDGTPL